jgi:hypothetical protein
MALYSSDAHISLTLANGIGFDLFLSCDRHMLLCKSFFLIHKRDHLDDCFFLVYSCEEPSTRWIATDFLLE